MFSLWGKGGVPRQLTFSSKFRGPILSSCGTIFEEILHHALTRDSWSALISRYFAEITASKSEGHISNNIMSLSTTTINLVRKKTSEFRVRSQLIPSDFRRYRKVGSRMMEKWGQTYSALCKLSTASLSVINRPIVHVCQYVWFYDNNCINWDNGWW